MFRFSMLSLLAVLLQCSTAVKADGLIYQLPEDGTWVKFEGDYTSEDVANGAMIAGKQSLTVSSVGRVVENGVACRWIEVKWVMQWGIPGKGQQQQKSVKKFLIPEEYLKKGEAPIKHVARAWFDDDNQSGAYTIPEDPYRWGIFYFEGPRESDDVENDAVESKLGALKCKRTTTSRQYKDEVYEHTYTDSTWLHEKAPFGVVRFEQKMESIRFGLSEVEKRMVANLVLVDFGRGAQTELPQYE